ncbi:hypothetical protein, partial [Actinokineospora alba]|uniref:hypothetical protein n=1 Tax=Actinokineospora alba TaxID=504798 RepID=UPI001E426B41
MREFPCQEVLFAHSTLAARILQPAPPPTRRPQLITAAELALSSTPLSTLTCDDRLATTRGCRRPSTAVEIGTVVDP